MSLAEKCSDSFDAQTRSKGQAYYSSGMVRDLVIRDDQISAKVRGTSASEYSVEYDLADPSGKEMIAHCTCPFFLEGNLCKHLWAVILANDNNPECITSPRPRVTVVHGEQVQDDEWSQAYLDDEDELDGEEPNDEVDGDEEVGSEHDAMVRLLPPHLRSLMGMETSSKLGDSKSRLSWKKQLLAIEGESRDDNRREDPAPRNTRVRQILYLLNVTASEGRQNLLAIEFYQQERKKNGDWGKMQRCQVRPDALHHLPTDEDQRLIGALIGNEPDERAESNYRYYGSSYVYSYRGFNRSWVRPAMYSWLLPQLAATGRFFWALEPSLTQVEDIRPVQWDAGEPWQYRVRVEPEPESGNLKILGEFQRGQETRPADSAVMILSDGLVLFPETLCRADTERDAAWVTALRKHGPIVVPAKDRVAMLRELTGMRRAPRLEVPPDICDMQTPITPVPRLEISSPPQRYAMYRDHEFWVKLSYRYGDQVFQYSDRRFGAFDEGANRIVARMPEREDEFRQRLEGLGLRHPSNYYAREEADFTLPHKRLGEIVRTLTEEGWLVETHGKKVRRPGEFKLDVATGVDWFELHGKLDFDGASASLPALLAALRNNEQFVRLDDGSQGMLPEAWLEKYGRIAQLAEAAGDTLRFTKSQGLLLDALLAEQQDVQLDAGFTDYRERLRSFAGVEATRPVDSFRGQLRPYQEEGLGWLHFLRDFRFGGCLADDMGLGKTVQVLALLEARRVRPLEPGEVRRPSIVVVPKSLVFNWIEEATRFAPGLRIVNHTGIERGALDGSHGDYDVVLTTYGTLRRDIVKLKDVQFDYAILDEAQAIKNASSQAAKACRLIRAHFRLAMSGTPIENHLGELWSLFDFLNPGMLGRSFAFANFARGAAGQDEHALQMLAKAVRPFLLRRTKEQVLKDLPEKMEQTLVCELSDKERNAYDELRDYYRVQLANTVKAKGMAKSKIHVLEALLRLRQAACHPGLLDRKKIGEESAKLTALLEQIQAVVDEGHKALIFSQFTSLLAIVRHHLDKDKIVYEYLDGQTRNRGERVKRFQEDAACPLFLISLKAGGHGLNLTAADYVFILDPWWNPAVEAQAVDRAHRLGQLRRVFAYRLIARDTVEDKILELQKTKKDLADAIVSANNSLIKSLTADDLDLLLS